MFLARTGRRCIGLAALACTAAATFATTAIAQTNSSLSGYVYIDRNNDGQLAFSNQSAPEWIIPDVAIELYSVNGTTESLLATTFTDAIGKYTFDGLTAGTYSVRQVQPIEYVDGLDTLGQIRALTGQLVANSFSVGQLAADAFTDILLPVGAVGEMYNFGERGLAPEYVSKRYLLTTAPPPQFATIPEPATAALAALAVLGWAVRKRKK